MKLELLAKCLNELIKNRPEFADKDICIEQTADGESKLYVTQYDETSKKWTKLYWIKNLNTIKESIMTKNIKKTYKVKNYKGNLVESLSKFQKSHKGMKIIEASEAKDGLKIVVEAEYDDAPPNPNLMEIVDPLKDCIEAYDSWFNDVVLDPEERDNFTELLGALKNFASQLDYGYAQTGPYEKLERAIDKFEKDCDNYFDYWDNK